MLHVLVKHPCYISEAECSESKASSQLNQTAHYTVISWQLKYEEAFHSTDSQEDHWEQHSLWNSKRMFMQRWLMPLHLTPYCHLFLMSHHILGWGGWESLTFSHRTSLVLPKLYGCFHCFTDKNGGKKKHSYCILINPMANIITPSILHIIKRRLSSSCCSHVSLHPPLPLFFRWKIN